MNKGLLDKKTSQTMANEQQRDRVVNLVAISGPNKLPQRQSKCLADISKILDAVAALDYRIIPVDEISADQGYYREGSLVATYTDY